MIVLGVVQGLEHWEEVFAVLEGETFSLFKDRAAAVEVRETDKTSNPMNTHSDL